MQVLCMFLRSTWQKTFERNMLREGCWAAFPSVLEAGTPSRGPAACMGQGFATSGREKEFAGCNLKARAMGFEPTQFALVKLESVLAAGNPRNKECLPGSARRVEARGRCWPYSVPSEKHFCWWHAPWQELALRRRVRAESPARGYSVCCGQHGQGLATAGMEKTLAGCNWS